MSPQVTHRQIPIALLVTKGARQNAVAPCRAGEHRLLHGLPDDETAVLMDEVEVHTNPKIDCQ
jgi:hypothetical protein